LPILIHYSSFSNNVYQIHRYNSFNGPVATSYIFIKNLYDVTMSFRYSRSIVDLSLTCSVVNYSRSHLFLTPVLFSHFHTPPKWAVPGKSNFHFISICMYQFQKTHDSNDHHPIQADFSEILSQHRKFVPLSQKMYSSMHLFCHLFIAIFNESIYNDDTNSVCMALLFRPHIFSCLLSLLSKFWLFALNHFSTKNHFDTILCRTLKALSQMLCIFIRGKPTVLS
jgi:hypothetical protein